MSSSLALRSLRKSPLAAKGQAALWLWCGLAATVGAVAFSRASSGEAFGWLGLVLGLVVIMACVALDRRVAAPLLAAFAVRAILALVHHYVTPLPDSQADAVMYEREGWEWAQRGLSYLLTHPVPGSQLYVWIVGVIYAITGRSPLLIQAVNVLLGSQIVWTVYRTSLALWDARMAVRAAWIVALFPTAVLYSCTTMREVVTVYPFMLGVLALVRWRKTQRIWHLLWCLLWLAVSAGFHTAMGAPLLVVCLLVLGKWLSSLRSRDPGLVRATILIVLVVAVIGFVLASGWALGKVGPATTLSLASLAHIQESASRGRAAYLNTVTMQSATDFAWQLPLRVVYFLFAPFPWMDLTPKDLLALVDSALVLALAAGLVCSARPVLSHAGARGVALVLVALIVVFALAVSNYGTALRHRSKLVPLMAVLLCVPLKRGHGRRSDSPASDDPSGKASLTERADIGSECSSWLGYLPMANRRIDSAEAAARNAVKLAKHAAETCVRPKQRGIADRHEPPLTPETIRDAVGNTSQGNARRNVDDLLGQRLLHAPMATVRREVHRLGEV